jgi:hypothetical protein
MIMMGALLLIGGMLGFAVLRAGQRGKRNPYRDSVDKPYRTS